MPLDFSSSIEEFVKNSGGNHVIKKILVANNGIGAIKAIRSVRRWCFETFGNERAIKFVVMATPEDLKANCEYIRMADEVVDVPGGTNNNNYANVNLICEIAEKCDADAVMPMWGHASENPNLPNTLLKCSSRKIAFVGPPAEPMQALGDKIGSTIIAQSAKVPTIAWNGDGLSVDYKALGHIPQDIYDKANVLTAEEAVACAERIGYPVMIKASEGGGGKGIRKVHSTGEVATAFRQVQGEIPGSPIFIMKMASNARHLEVQLLADQYGDAIALSGRDCSVQRRHQKIIEEGPPVAAPVSVFRQMENAAVALAKTVGYCNCGTVEFLYLEESQSFAFLELNPRLQVEHPVTENILGLNLPACQVQVAMGIPLHRISDIRVLYGRHPAGCDTIDFKYAERAVAPRHCIAVRVTAENPDAGFQPTSGKIQELHFRSSVDVWGYFSVNSSGLIHEFADSQFGHIFAAGVDRESARRALVVALKGLEIRGGIRTTVEYIIKMVQSEDFIANRINTDWLDGRITRHKTLLLEESRFELSPNIVVTCGSALQGFSFFQEKGAEFKSLLSIGQVPTRDTLTQSVPVDLIFNNIKYNTKCTLSGPTSVIVDCNDESQKVKIRPLADGGYLIDINGNNHVAYVQRDGAAGTLCIILDGRTCIFTPEYDPTRLVSSVAGKIARTLVQDGAHVGANEPYVEVEVMKMFMPLKTSVSGVISFQKSEGAGLVPGDLIATMILDNPDMVVKAEVFRDSLFRTSGLVRLGSCDMTDEDVVKPHLRLRESLSKLELILKGYPMSVSDIRRHFKDFVNAFKDKLLPVYEVDEALSVLRGRLDANLMTVLIHANTMFKEAVLSGSSMDYPAGLMLSRIHEVYVGLPADKITAFYNTTLNVWSVIEKYLFDLDVRYMATLVGFIEQYLEVEKLFDSMSFTDVVTSLRKDTVFDLDSILGLCRSHVNLSAKNELITCVIEEIKRAPKSGAIGLSTGVNHPTTRKLPVGVPIRNEISCRNLKIKLAEVAKLHQSLYSQVSLSANLLLMEQKAMPLELRRQRLNDAIIAALSTGDGIGVPGERVSEMTKFADSNIGIRDLFLESLQLDRDYQIAAVEIYIRKLYQKTHYLENMQSGYCLGSGNVDSNVWVKFDFIAKSSGLNNSIQIGDDTIDNFAVLHDLIVTGRNGYGMDNTYLSTPGRSGAYSPNDGLSRNNSNAFEDTGMPELNDDPAASLMSFPGYPITGRRHGVFAILQNLSEIPKFLPLIAEKIPVCSGTASQDVNALHIVIMQGLSEGTSDDITSDEISKLLAPHEESLKSRQIRRVTFIVGPRVSTSDPLVRVLTPTNSMLNTSFTAAIPQGSVGTIFTFRAKGLISEDKLFRHIEAPYAFHLDLPRLNNYTVQLEEGMQTISGNVHLYRARPRNSQGQARYFVRLLSFSGDMGGSENEALFVEALDLLRLAISKANPTSNVGRSRSAGVGAQSNHIFLNVVAPDSVLSPEVFEQELEKMCTKYALKLRRLAVADVEVKLTCKLAQECDSVGLRFRVSNPTGFVNNIDQYVEVRGDGGRNTVFRSIGSKGEWDGLITATPYEISHKFSAERAEAMAASDTLYVYDWPVLFGHAVETQWQEYLTERSMPKVVNGKLHTPRDPFVCQELVLCDPVEKVPLESGWEVEEANEAILLPTLREPGRNDVGMVAWLISFITPESAGKPRQAVIICNDITYEAGSFGTREDVVFYKASQYARERGLPRLFLAANSGARIGVAESLKSKFRVAWTDENDPAKGFRYIYLTKADYDQLVSTSDGGQMPLICSQTRQPDGEERYVITDIIGTEPNLGVENLMGSGLIAGETSRAYDDVFTLTLVVGRTVGIGAYLVRLGQRTIQKTRHSPIILTGYQALNKLMGREIYTSNDQLGGPMIMYPNGVSHLLGENHIEVVQKALQWLSFVPLVKGQNAPVIDIRGLDSVERTVGFMPHKSSTYDPRLLLCGSPLNFDPKRNAGENWQGGFFDRNSFVETLGGWAKTVIVGRARLGGIPMGVIITENRTAEATKPADPADMTSTERMVQQAGGVWFPDSAYKTAQALKDFNREGLPCMVFANWRGFSGGQRDMFDEVLKFGSMIVDALVAYQQPLFVYIPPFAELRGGAWVVVDHTINANVMEFYAADEARGGVLEAAGTAAIKFREKDIVATSNRLDPVIMQWNKELAELKKKEGDHSAQIDALNKQIKHRLKLLAGVYQQIAVHFCDLHDTPGRMKAKEVIRKQVKWAESRTFFYWRLRRLLAELDIIKQLQKADSQVVSQRAVYTNKIKDFFHSKCSASVANISGGKGVNNQAIHQSTHNHWDNDKYMANWYTEHSSFIKEFVSAELSRLMAIRVRGVMQSVYDGVDQSASFDTLSLALKELPDTVKADILKALQG